MNAQYGNLLPESTLTVQHNNQKIHSNQRTAQCAVIVKLSLHGIYNFEEDDTLKAIYLTAGARDALGAIRHGIPNYVRLFPTFGEKSPFNIEQAVRLGFRWGVLPYPGTKAFGNIHNIKKTVTAYEAMEHDDYHCKVMNTIVVEIREGFMVAIDYVREEIVPDIKPKSNDAPVNLAEFWYLTDCELMRCYHNSDDFNSKEFRENLRNPTQLTILFWEVLVYGLGSDRVKHYILDERAHKDQDRNLTTFTIMLLLKFIAVPTAMKKTKIDFDTLLENKFINTDQDVLTIQNSYKNIKKLHKYIEYDHFKIKLLKILLYPIFQNKELSQFLTLSTLISQNKQNVLEKLIYRKTNPSDIKKENFRPDQVNTIYLSYGQFRLYSNPEKNKPVIEALQTKFSKN